MKQIDKVIYEIFDTNDKNFIRNGVIISFPLVYPYKVMHMTFYPATMGIAKNLEFKNGGDVLRQKTMDISLTMDRLLFDPLINKLRDITNESY